MFTIKYIYMCVYVFYNSIHAKKEMKQISLFFYGVIKWYFSFMSLLFMSLSHEPCHFLKSWMRFGLKKVRFETKRYKQL